MSFPSSTSCWVFDVDGVLIDSRDAVREAYAISGVDQPEDVWGISWKLWLPAIVGDRAAEVHAAKQEAYAALLERGAGRRLPGADMAESLLLGGHKVAFVTAASQASAEAVLQCFNFEADLLWGYELSSDERRRALEDIAAIHCEADTFTYIDDREEGRQIATAAGFDFLHATWTL